MRQLAPAECFRFVCRVKAEMLTTRAMQCFRQSFGKRHFQSLVNQSRSKSQKTRFVWTPIPISLGILVIAGMQYRKMSARPTYESNHDIKVDGDWYIHLYMMLPLRTLSRLWGELNAFTVPEFLRRPLYSTYVFQII